MTEKFVLFFGGGTMSGMFGMGVLSAFERADIHSRIEAIYAVSAGALNGAYFLAGQSELGATVYYDNLVNGFIKPEKIPMLLLHACLCAVSGGGRPTKGMDIVSIDYLFEVLERDKMLDIPKLSQRGVPLFVKLINLNTGQLVYHNVLSTGRPMQVLKSAVSVVPYYSVCKRADEESWADGALLEPLGVTSVLARHPYHKVVAVLNTRPSRGKMHKLKACAEGLVTSAIYPGMKLYNFLKREQRFNREMAEISGHPRITIISPRSPKEVRPNLTNRDCLLGVYEMGLVAGQEFVQAYDD